MTVLQYREVALIGRQCCDLSLAGAAHVSLSGLTANFPETRTPRRNLQGQMRIPPGISRLSGLNSVGGRIQATANHYDPFDMSRVSLLLAVLKRDRLQ